LEEEEGASLVEEGRMKQEEVASESLGEEERRRQLVAA